MAIAKRCRPSRQQGRSLLAQRFLGINNPAIEPKEKRAIRTPVPMLPLELPSATRPGPCESTTPCAPRRPSTPPARWAVAVLWSQEGRPPLFHAAAIFGLQPEGRRHVAKQQVSHPSQRGWLLREFSEMHYFFSWPQLAPSTKKMCKFFVLSVGSCRVGTAKMFISIPLVMAAELHCSSALRSDAIPGTRTKRTETFLGSTLTPRCGSCRCQMEITYHATPS